LGWRCGCAGGVERTRIRYHLCGPRRRLFLPWRSARAEFRSAVEGANPGQESDRAGSAHSGVARAVQLLSAELRHATRREAACLVVRAKRVRQSVEMLEPLLGAEP